MTDIDLTAINADLRRAGPHRTRPLRFLRPERIAGWRFKLYTIATHGEAARPAFVDETLRRVPEVYGSWPAADTADPRHGIGFITAHDATSSCIALYYWWQSFNELHLQIHVGPKHDPRAMTRWSGQAAGCVWELEIVDFERRAWLADVLANPGGPDLERYLGRHVDIEL
jgi:hypothetical protein